LPDLIVGGIVNWLAGMVVNKMLPLIIISVFLAFILLSHQAVENLAVSQREVVKNIANPRLNKLNNDPMMDFLGKSFDGV